MATKNDNDVLCGRGGLSNQHPGNRMFRRIVNENKEFYHKCKSPTRKHLLVVSIIQAIQVHGGRFVRKRGNSWIEISHKEACVKTSQALRDSAPDSSSSGSVATSKSKENIKTSNKKPSNKKCPSPPPASNPSVQTVPSNIPSTVECGLSDFLEEGLKDLLFSLDDDDIEIDPTASEDAALISDDDEFEPLPAKPQTSDVPLDLNPLQMNDFSLERTTDFQNLCQELAMAC